MINTVYYYVEKHSELFHRQNRINYIIISNMFEPAGQSLGLFVEDYVSGRVLASLALNQQSLFVRAVIRPG